MASVLSIGVFALVKVLAHLWWSDRYGYFRDELYYLACADHLDLGYVDHPPLSIAVLWVVRSVFGDSIEVLRVSAAVIGAATVALTGLIARRLGGGLFAQALAMTASLIAPVVLGVNSFYSMNSLDLFFWACGAYLLVRLVDRGRRRDWVLLGVVVGLGLLNKISVLWLAAAIAAGLLLTPLRRSLITPWPWIAGSIAALLFLPHVLWQVAHGWPTLEFMRNARTMKMASDSPLEFVLGQVLAMHPLAVPVWLGGLFYLWFGSRLRKYRLLAFVYVVPFAILILSGSSRINYLAPAYAVLLAAGGVAFEDWTRGDSLRRARPVLIALLLTAGAAVAPLALPILPPERYVAYAEAIGLQPPSEERQAVGPLPQHLADRCGWEEIVATVASAYRSLPAGERVHAGIFTGNYGEAGAIDVLGRRFGLPRAISGHNSYWLWGPRGYDGRALIVLSGGREELEEIFDEVREVDHVRCGFCMPFENGRPVFVCRRPKLPVDRLWSRVKKYL